MYDYNRNIEMYMAVFTNRYFKDNGSRFISLRLGYNSVRIVLRCIQTDLIILVFFIRPQNESTELYSIDRYMQDLSLTIQNYTLL